MGVLSKIFSENPVLTKELRVRMRGARAYWILLGYLLFLAVVMLFTYNTFQGDVATAGVGGSNSSQVGLNLFRTLEVCQIFLVLFITPAITSGSITIEKEQQTIDLLTMSRLSRLSIVSGKMLSAIAFTALLLVSSLPLVSICFMLGSIDPAMVLSVYLEMLCGSFLIGAIGLMWSSIVKTTTNSVLLTYLSMLAIMTVVSMLYASLNLLNGPLGGAGSGGILVVAWAALANNLFGPAFMGFTGLEGMGFMVTCILIGCMCVVIAMSRLETFPDRRAGILRALTAAIILFLLTTINLWWLNTLYTVNTGPLVKSPALGALLIPITLLMLLIPIFATGELQPYEARKFFSYYLKGWTPKGLNRGKLASGLPFLVILSVLCLFAYVGSFAIFRKLGDVNNSSNLPGFVTAVAPLPTAYPNMGKGYNGFINTGGHTLVYSAGVVVTVDGVPVPTAGSTPTKAPPVVPKTGLAAIKGDFPQAALVFMTFVVGFSLLCQFLSVAFRNRWIAFVLASLILGVILFLPLVNLATAGGDTPFFTAYLVLLNPLVPLLPMTDPSVFAPSGPTNSSYMVDLAYPIWFYCAAGWGLIGAISFAFMLPFVRREAKSSKPIPYEELIAEA